MYRTRKAQDFEDIHHIFWPRTDYITQLEKRFRNLKCNKVKMHRRDHNDLHRTQTPPPKPSRRFMLATMEVHRNRGCGICFPEGIRHGRPT